MQNVLHCVSAVGMLVVVVGECGLQQHVALVLAGVERWDSVVANGAAIEAAGGSRYHLHFNLVADQGTVCLGIGDFLPTKGVSVAMWRDPLHRLANCSTLSIATSSAVSRAVRLCRKLFRLSRAPYYSTKFGRILQSAGPCLSFLSQRCVKGHVYQGEGGGGATQGSRKSAFVVCCEVLVT